MENERQSEGAAGNVDLGALVEEVAELELHALNNCFNWSEGYLTGIARDFEAGIRALQARAEQAEARVGELEQAIEKSSLDPNKGGYSCVICQEYLWPIHADWCPMKALAKAQANVPGQEGGGGA